MPGIRNDVEAGHIDPSYVEMAYTAAQEAGLENPSVFLNQIYQESNFDPDAESSSCYGIAQIRENGHVAERYDIDPVSATPQESLRIAAEHMADLVAYTGSIGKALVAYNGGTAALEYAVNNYDGLDKIQELTTQQWLDFMQEMRAAHGTDDPSKWRVQTYDYVQKILGEQKHSDTQHHAEQNAESPRITVNKETESQDIAASQHVTAQVQSYLYALGYDEQLEYTNAQGQTAYIDGIAGSSTTAALKAFVDDQAGIDWADYAEKSTRQIAAELHNKLQHSVAEADRAHIHEKISELAHKVNTLGAQYAANAILKQDKNVALDQQYDIGNNDVLLTDGKYGPETKAALRAIEDSITGDAAHSSLVQAFDNAGMVSGFGKLLHGEMTYTFSRISAPSDYAQGNAPDHVLSEIFEPHSQGSNAVQDFETGQPIAIPETLEQKIAEANGTNDLHSTPTHTPQPFEWA